MICNESRPVLGAKRHSTWGDAPTNARAGEGATE